MNSDLICKALQHLMNNKTIKIIHSTGGYIHVTGGVTSIPSTVDVLLGDDSDLVTDIELLDEPADADCGDEYIVAHYPAVEDGTFYFPIKAKTVEDADALAYSLTTDGAGGGEYDLYRRVM